MLMTALLSLASLQQPSMIMSQSLSTQPDMVQTNEQAAAQSHLFDLNTSPSLTAPASSTKACSKARYSRRSCGGTGRRQVLS